MSDMGHSFPSNMCDLFLNLPLLVFDFVFLDFIMFSQGPIGVYEVEFKWSDDICRRLG